MIILSGLVLRQPPFMEPNPMTPTYEELLLGGTSWYFQELPVTYKLAFHGHRTGREYQDAELHPGIWCYYLLIAEQMFPHRWEDFVPSEDGETWDRYSTHSILHEMFDTEITYHQSKPYLCRKTGKTFDSREVGCDYNHLWHRERGYPDTFESVKADARKTVEAFLKVNPDYNYRCAYSGLWDKPENFTQTARGAWVHNSKIEAAGRFMQ